jgi:hypothetical protein
VEGCGWRSPQERELRSGGRGVPEEVERVERDVVFQLPRHEVVEVLWTAPANEKLHYLDMVRRALGVGTNAGEMQLDQDPGLLEDGTVADVTELEELRRLQRTTIQSATNLKERDQETTPRR